MAAENFFGGLEVPYIILSGGQRPKGAGRRREGAPALRAGAPVPSSH